MEAERRFVEFRATDDGIITGTAVRYGDVARIGDFSERFEAGSLRYDDVMVNLMHRREAPVARTGAGLTLSNTATALEARIELPDTSYAREARELVSARILRGMSVEFRAIKDRWEDRNRIIEDAALVAIGLVDVPAYPDSVIAQRMQDAYERITGNPHRERGGFRAF